MANNNNSRELSVVLLNCNSMYRKLAEIKLLVYTTKPSVICLTETWAKNNWIPSFVGYSSLWNNRQGNAGGTCISVYNGINFKEIVLNPFLNGILEQQCIEVVLYNGSLLRILNVYNPNKDLSKQEFLHYLAQLGATYIITGDFNGHSPLLCTRDQRSNNTGKTIEEVMLQDSICLVNELDFFTYIDRRTGLPSCLDLFFTSANIIDGMSLVRMKDVGSDHFPLQATTEIFTYFTERKQPKRWIMDKESLRNFAANLGTSQVMQPLSVEETYANIQDRIIKSAVTAFKKTSGKPREGKQSSWWSEECKSAVGERRKAKKVMEAHPTAANCMNYRKKSAEARCIIQRSKRENRRKFISDITYNTPMTIVWKKLKAFTNKKVVDNEYAVQHNGEIVVNELEKANLFVDSYIETTKIGKHKIPPDMDEVINNYEVTEQNGYNQEITMEELRNSIRGLRNTSTGSDEIHNKFLKCFNEETMEEIKRFFNFSYEMGIVPEQWKEGIMIPILKPYKDRADIKSYRPITLLSCLGKVMEKVIKARLEYHLESKNLFSSSQCGFRGGQGTMDILLRLEHLIRTARDSRKVCLIIYIDLKGAFDRIWHKALLYKMAKMNISGKLRKWIANYLENRSIKVRLNECTSESRSLRSGVPQGPVISPTLFNIMLADVPQQEGVFVLCYADDATVTATAESALSAKKILNEYLKKFKEYCETWGLVVGMDKTFLQYYTRKRMKAPIIRYSNSVIKFKKTHKILGMLFDSPNLTFKQHIEHTFTECMRRMNILKHIASPNWGSSKKILKLFYCSYIRSKIDYGSIIYHNASENFLQKLDKLQNQCIRTMLGARKTTPISALHAEANILPLVLRRKFLTAKTYYKLKYRPELDVTSKMLEDCIIPNGGSSALQRCANAPAMYKFEKCKRMAEEMPNPPWETVNDFIEENIDDENEIITDSTFKDFLEQKYPNFIEVYTDGSRAKIIDGSWSVAAGVYISREQLSFTWRMNPLHSVIAAELLAIQKALELIQDKYSMSNCVICSDSRSSLKMLKQNKGSYIHIIKKIQNLIRAFNKRGMVKLQWVKSHCGIKGNEIADKVAKLGLQANKSILSNLAKSEASAHLKKTFDDAHLEEWVNEVSVTRKGLHRRNIDHKIRNYPWLNNKSRRVEVVMSRLRLGHVGVMQYLHRFGMSASSVCAACNVNETIEHFVLNCVGNDVPRTRMMEELNKIGIINPTLSDLLGAGDHRNHIQYKINKLFISFLIQTGRMQSL